jgi:hypothetical protein
MSATRSATAPPGEAYDSEHHDEDGMTDTSSLYARCDASVSRSLNARRLREAADNDVRFLQNRLNKLKAEENRAKSEIAKLRQKTSEVLENKHRHEENTSQRANLKDQVDYGKRKEAALIALNKERQAKAVWSSKQRVMLDKRESVLAMRKQKEINECRVHIQKEEMRDKNSRQRSAIRTLHSNSQARRAEEAEAKREEVRAYYDRRIEAEQAEREKKEKLAAQLVAQEAQLIYRLKRMHQEKQNALKGLAAAVETPAGSRPGTSHTTLPPIN